MAVGRSSQEPHQVQLESRAQQTLGEMLSDRSVSSSRSREATAIMGEEVTFLRWQLGGQDLSPRAQSQETGYTGRQDSCPPPPPPQQGLCGSPRADPSMSYGFAPTPSLPGMGIWAYSF